jgi:PAS domain S-box-containing protein
MGFAAFFITCLLAVPAAAAPPVPTVPATPAPDAHFTHITVEQGLSQSTVQVLFQDHLGFIWLGTEEGLNRYDGYTFAIFRNDPQDPDSLPDNIITMLFEDRAHRLWVGTATGLAVFSRETETFERLPGIRQRVNGMVEEPDGTLWVGTEGQGLFERSGGAGVFVPRSQDSREGFGLDSHAVTALLRDKGGRLWIGTRDRGLFRLLGPGENAASEPAADAAGGRRFAAYRRDPGGRANSLAHDEVWGLAEDKEGRIWVATYGGGISVLSPQTGEFTYHRAPSLPTDLVTSVIVDRQGTVWVGTDGFGVLRYEAGAGQFVAYAHHPSDPASLSDNVVRALYEDIQGQLWVGTFEAGANLLRTPRQAFGYHAHTVDAAGLRGATVESVLEDAQGYIWVGTTEGWLSRFEPETGVTVRYKFPSTMAGGTPLVALLQDRRARFWVGTYRDGLARFDPARGTFKVYRHASGDPRTLSNDEVWALAEDEDGSLWLGTNGQLDHFDPEQGVVVAHHDLPNAEGLTTSGVRALLFDREHNLWIGTLGGGLGLRLRGGAAVSRYAHSNRPGSLSHDHVISLHEDARGRLWVGTYGGGLNLLDRANGTFTAYKAFPSNVIYSIAEDARGRLWLGTNQGLSRFDPDTGKVDSYDLSNGLRSLEFQRGAAVRSRARHLLFGSRGGFHDFDPEDIRPDTYAPPVRLTALRSFNTPVKPKGGLLENPGITLTHRDKVFSLEFAALDYTFPKRNQYAYLMEGFSDRWIDLGGKLEVTVTKLDPGTYMFRVKASNRDGVWSPDSTAALRVVVRPPFWGTWWFRAAVTGLVLLALLAADRVRVRRLTAALTERTRAERAVRKAEEKYRGIFENALEGIYQSTPDGHFLTVNPALARMLGYTSPEEMLADVTDIGRQLYVDPARRGEMLGLLDEYGVVHDFECELRRRDGRSVWASVSVRLVRDEAGQPLYFEGAIQDISDRWRAQQAEGALRNALRTAAEEWERTFDAMDVPILLVDHRGRIVRLNRAARDLLGSQPEPTERRVGELAPGQPWQKAGELAARVASTRTAAHDQAHDETSGRTWDLTAGPAGAFAGGEERVIVVARDLTRVVSLQESLRRSETMSAMGALVAGVAHEVRNPLFGISANLDAFEARAGAEFKPFITLLQREVKRLAALMQGLLDYGKPAESAPEPGTLEAVVREATESCAALAATREVRVASQGLEAVPPVPMIRKRLVQVVQNLLQNAIQHSKAGSEVGVTARVEDDARGPWAVLEVRDSGPGFAAQDISRIFEPFFSRRRGGTGLGLAIVQRIVVEHGGTVTVGNRAEGGALVTVRLPRYPPPGC